MYTPQILSLISACQWDTTRFLIISQNVFDPFIYYSHLLPLVLSLAIGIFVFRKDKTLLGKILFFITVCFSVWVSFDLIVWATDKPPLTMFFWSIENLIEPMIYAASAYFAYVFITGKDLTFRQKVLLVLPFIPTILLAPTSLNLVSYDLSNCNRDAIEGLLPHYNYVIEVGYAIWILGFAAERIWWDKVQRARTAVLTTGVVLFLLMFAWGNIVGSFTDDWKLPQWGLFGMPIFVAFLAYLIVRYKAFNIKVVGAQVLVFASVILTVSLFFVDTIHTTHVITALNVVLLSVLGFNLVRGVTKEAEQLEEIQGLAKRLEGVLHLVSHDVKGALGSNHSLYTEILAGDYGQVSDELKGLVQGADFSTIRTIDMTTTVLRAADNNGGQVHYDMRPFDLKGAVLETIAYVAKDAKAKGLDLKTVIPEGIDWTIIGDRAQILEHVLRNLLTNAVIYTPSGSIIVGLERMNGKVIFTVKDTGVGISPEDMSKLFTEGGHGKDSTKINVHSTGFGLYLAKTVIDAHHGRLSAESKGPGQGSTFVVELPI